MILVSSCLVSVQSIETRCWVENEDVVGAAPTGDAPTTSEWSMVLLPDKVHLILEVLMVLILDSPKLAHEGRLYSVFQRLIQVICSSLQCYVQFCWCAILIAHQIVMAKHGGSCVHFSRISTCGRTSRETVSHPQCPPLPTLCKISLPIYVIVTNKLLQPLTTTWYDSLVLSFSLLKI